MTLWNSFRFALPAVATLLVAIPVIAAPIPGLYTTFGSNSESSLARIDPDTGTVTVVGRITGADVGMVGGLAYDSRDGILYGVAWSSDYLGGNYWGSLFRIDPSTALAELVGETGHIFVGGLAYDSKHDVLYGGAGYYPEKYLIRIDPDTGVGTRVGRRWRGGIAALEYLPRSDRLLSVDVTFDPPRSSLWEVNRTTGLHRLIGRPRRGGIYGIAYDPTTDRLYALPGSTRGADPAGDLRTIDPNTGVVLSHQSLSRWALYNSMAYVPDPRAGPAALLAAAGVITGSQRLRRRQKAGG